MFDTEDVSQRVIQAPRDIRLDAEVLRREIEILELQHLEAEFEGADDETIPRLVEEIRADGKSSLNQYWIGY